MTLICVPVRGADMRSARAMADAALSSGADLVELRADLIPGADRVAIAELFSDILDRTIITLRSELEGGGSSLEGEERAAWLREAATLPAAFLDLELQRDERMIPELSDRMDRIIVSAHFFGEWDSDEASEALSRSCKLGGIGKIALRADNALQALEILRLLGPHPSSKAAVMAMGAGAEISRALAASAGSALVYCALDSKSAVVPGQLDLATQKRLSSHDSIVTGLLGHPLGHTLSPLMHNAAFAELGLPGIYLPYDIPEASQVPRFFELCKRFRIRGLNVTIPYKEVAFSAVDALDDEARRAGAVNTVVLEENGGFKGYNTDIFGFAESIRQSGYDPRNRRALIVGAGGASRAAMIALWKMGAKMTVANRTPERAEELVRSMRLFVKTIGLDELPRDGMYELIVNATPVGMSGFDCSDLIPDAVISKAEAVMDMVYNPLETPLISAAKRKGVKTISGLDMLLYQGARAFELWTGKQAPVDIMRRVLKEAMSR